METQKLRIAGVVTESIVDGPGFRYTIFTQGCPHHCPGCHNPQTHDFEGGAEVDIDVLYQEIVENKILDGVTLSGGEPFCQPQPLTELVLKLKEQGMHIIAYSGYTWEELLRHKDPNVRKLLEACDWLIDGKYEESLRNLSLEFRGSSNQRVIDIKPSLLQENEPILLYT